MPFNASTGGVQEATQGSASVTSSQGAAFGANFQPPPQMQPPMHMHPNNVQPPATFTAPQSVSSSVSSILPSDSASVTHADLQGNSGSIQRTGPTTYYQSMTGPLGRSDSGFYPPTANMVMVKRPVAFTALVSSVTTSQGAASEVDKRNILYKAAINALGLDEFDSESDDEPIPPASPGFGYWGNSCAGNIQAINVAGDNVGQISRQIYQLGNGRTRPQKGPPSTRRRSP